MPSARLKRILMAQVVLTGDAEIDADHERFVRLVEQLCDAVSAARPKGEILAISRSIADDAAEHFGSEEAAMARHGYWGLTTHRAAHMRVLREIEKAISAIAAARTRSQIVRAANELQQMLLDHMLRFDVGYKFHLQQQVQRST